MPAFLQRSLLSFSNRVQCVYYRLRVGDYRILYKVQDEALVVLIVKVGHRCEVYRKR
jgi:mRNA-degrading endonuclease RelE of RelBE toxin-antitoxin system